MNNIILDRNLVWKLTMFSAIAAIAMMIPEMLYANSQSTLDNTLCIAVNNLTGRTGKAIGTIALIVLAIGWFLGKISWGVVVMTIVGIGVMFGAGELIEFIADDPNIAECS